MSSGVVSIDRLVHQLGKLPGIGPKTAQRLAYHLLAQPASAIDELAESIVEAKARVHFCSVCGNYTEADPCALCTDVRRHNGLLCVVRDPRDVMAIERMRDYHGRYHVLHGALSPMEGVGPDDIRIAELMRRLGAEDIAEVILATNPDIEGEATASYIARLIKPMGIKVSRISHGVPVGGDLEYTDELTLAKAIEARREL